MSSITAKPLVPREPFAIVRTGPSAVLKFQGDKTAFAKPENVAISSAALRGVFVREELISTGCSAGIAVIG